MKAAIDLRVSELVEQVQDAIARQQPLRIAGGGSKQFCTPEINAQALAVDGLSGILSHEPAELVLSALAGTPLREIEQQLQDHRQMLAFEPPLFSDSATLGGVIATAQAGPRRSFGGAARDSVLGVSCINGHGEHLHFGGQVMKNVAGFDVSRLMTGAWGTLGVLTSVSVRLWPQPQMQQTRVLELDAARALQRMREWSRESLPLSALCHVDGRLYVRLSGASQAVAAAAGSIAGEVLTEDAAFWHSWREQTDDWFRSDVPLWRCVVPVDTPIAAVSADAAIDWAGGLRWWHTPEAHDQVIARVRAAGGHAHLFRPTAGQQAVMTPPHASIMDIHRRLKQAFDPYNLFNPGLLF